MVINPPRLQALDSLRGIAAFVVLLTHCYLGLPQDIAVHLGWLRFSPLRIFISGHAAVILFFVLSGTVLALTFSKAENFLNGGEYGIFVIKRLCRIYLPFIAVISLLAVCYCALIHHLPLIAGASWLNERWPQKENIPGAFFRHVIMSGRPQDMWLDGVMWSLVHEMRISFLFPFLVLGCRRFRHPLWAAVILFVAASVWLSEGGMTDDAFTQSDYWAITFLLTLRYIPFFIIGIALTEKANTLQNYVSNLTKRQHFFIWTIVFCIFCIPPTIRSLPETIVGYDTSIISQFLPHISDGLVGIAAAFAIVLSRENYSTKSILALPFIQWLGKISYSLYLVHLPIITIFFRLLLGQLPLTLILVITIATSLGVAHMTYLLIEYPSKKFGYRAIKNLGNA